MNNLNTILDYLRVFNNINKRPAYEPRTMAQEPRNMYAGGQLVQNTDDGSRPGYASKDKISFKVQLRAPGGYYTKMYSMEEVRKLGKELNVSEYNKKTGIKLTSDEYEPQVPGIISHLSDSTKG